LPSAFILHQLASAEPHRSKSTLAPIPVSQ
jgi:hypothetical protein